MLIDYSEKIGIKNLKILFNTDDNRPLFYKKDISLLARNGFDFETSKKVMDIEKDDYLKIIRLL